MRVGIFGGSFNPPHKMHEDIALYLIKNKYVDKVIFVPTGSKYEYKNNLNNDIDRFNMVKLITDGNSNLDVSDYELKDHVIYTFNTLEYFKNKYKNDEIFFICGADNLSYMDTWKNGEYILNNYKILVVKRSSDDIDSIINRLDKYKDNIIITDIEMLDISSTEIRNDIESNKDSLNKKVYEYIKSKHLYK